MTRLEDIKYGRSNVYWCRKNKFYCCVLTSHPDDAAYLIVEELDCADLEPTDNLASSESCYLSPRVSK